MLQGMRNIVPDVLAVHSMVIIEEKSAREGKVLVHGPSCHHATCSHGSAPSHDGRVLVMCS